jgi:hypothetical protein
MIDLERQESEPLTIPVIGDLAAQFTVAISYLIRGVGDAENYGKTILVALL